MSQKKLREMFGVNEEEKEGEADDKTANQNLLLATIFRGRKR